MNTALLANNLNCLFLWNIYSKYFCYMKTSYKQRIFFVFSFGANFLTSGQGLYNLHIFSTVYTYI